MIRLKRSYETASKDDGLRILVERLWPRGVSKRNAKIDLWLKDVAAQTRSGSRRSPQFSVVVSIDGTGPKGTGRGKPDWRSGMARVSGLARFRDEFAFL